MLAKLKIFTRKIFTLITLHRSAVNMEASSLVTSLNRVLQDVVKGPIVIEGKFMRDKLHKHR